MAPKDVFHTKRFLRIQQVLDIFPVSRTTWYRGITEGRFPAPIRLGPNTSAWRESDIAKLVKNYSEVQ